MTSSSRGFQSGQDRRSGILWAREYNLHYNTQTSNLNTHPTLLFTEHGQAVLE
jgi:hypothetical protein